MVKIAINGFGRIGKKFLLSCLEKDVKWDFVINDISDIKNITYLLEHDSIPSHKLSVKAAKNPDSVIVYGVNSNVLNKQDQIISAGSCTTNCIAPMVKILNDEFGIKSAHFVTCHAYTAT